MSLAPRERIHATHPDRPDVVELRSDTFTQPTPEMRRAMAEADVGDDLFDEDPTMQRLEAAAARRMGKEAAMFVPTGSMGNLAAILALTGGRAEVLAERRAHIFHYESGSLFTLGGCGPWPIDVDRGILTPEAVRGALRTRHFTAPRQGLLSIENTVNGWSGAVWTRNEVTAAVGVAREAGLAVHCDGARIFNAAIAAKTDPARLVAPCDTVTFCFSKGLSAPVGSIVCGSAATMEKAVHVRKMLGGGMRQAGILAAACQVALDTMVERLAEDHRTARKLAQGLHALGYGVDPDRCPTNIVVFDVKKAGWDSSQAFLSAVEPGGLRGLPVGPSQVRFVTHRHVTPAKVEKALAVLEAATRRAGLSRGPRGSARTGLPSGPPTASSSKDRPGTRHRSGPPRPR